MNELIGTVEVNGPIAWMREFRCLTGAELLPAKAMFELLKARGYKLVGNPNSLLVAGILQDRWLALAGKEYYQEVLDLAVKVALVQQDADLDRALLEMTLNQIDLVREIDFEVNEIDLDEEVLDLVSEANQPVIGWLDVDVD